MIKSDANTYHSIPMSVTDIKMETLYLEKYKGSYRVLIGGPREEDESIPVITSVQVSPHEANGLFMRMQGCRVFYLESYNQFDHSDDTARYFFKFVLDRMGIKSQ